MTLPIPAPVAPVLSEVVPFTAEDRRKLNEIHAAITSISEAVAALPLDKLSKSPVFRMLGF